MQGILKENKEDENFRCISVIKKISRLIERNEKQKTANQ